MRYLSAVAGGGAETASPYGEDSFCETYGDVEGIDPADSMTSLRLRHDPCGDGWADFLLPKAALLLPGTAAVIAAAIFRFPGAVFLSDGEAVDAVGRAVMDRCNSFYVVASLAQFFSLIIWAVLIVSAAIGTGKKLRTEPFLSTRPAQLAYRVLLSILILGLTAVVVPILAALITLVGQWTLGNRLDQTNNDQGDVVCFQHILCLSQNSTHYYRCASESGRSYRQPITVQQISRQHRPWQNYIFHYLFIGRRLHFFACLVFPPDRVTGRWRGI